MHSAFEFSGTTWLNMVTPAMIFAPGGLGGQYDSFTPCLENSEREFWRAFLPRDVRVVQTILVDLPGTVAHDWRDATPPPLPPARSKLWVSHAASMFTLACGCTQRFS